jgi:hypothetical protein
VGLSHEALSDRAALSASIEELQKGVRPAGSPAAADPPAAAAEPTQVAVLPEDFRPDRPRADDSAPEIIDAEFVEAEEETQEAHDTKSDLQTVVDKIVAEDASRIDEDLPF